MGTSRTGSASGAATGGPGRRSTRDAYRRVIGLTGPLLPCVSFLGRLPTATVQFGSVLLVARTSGSLSAAGVTGGALALGQVACGPLVGRLADRHGQRVVVLAFRPTPSAPPAGSRKPDGAGPAGDTARPRRPATPVAGAPSGCGRPG
ncbi:hypothetical protein AMK32_26815 [Streptomyces sp. CB01883]|nr:hypothetical protein AMK32_26815 [Streptomyces sp. CB01883]